MNWFGNKYNDMIVVVRNYLITRVLSATAASQMANLLHRDGFTTRPKQVLKSDESCLSPSLFT